MTSFKDARNLLLESYNDGIIDDNEFILLYEGNFSKNPDQNFHMKITKDSTWMRWTIRNTKLNFASRKMKFQG